MKKGISLIVLLITIIIIIILAGSVILSITQNNPIGDAKKAVSDSDKVAIQSQVVLKLSAAMNRNKSDIVIGTGADIGSFVATTNTPALMATVSIENDVITYTAGTAKYKCGDELELVYDSDKITLPAKIGNWYIDKNGTVTFAQ